METSAFAFLLLAMAPAISSSKSCADLQQEIADKLKAKGVAAYRLDIVPAAETRGANVVGNCEAGRKKIVYKK